MAAEVAPTTLRFAPLPQCERYNHRTNPKPFKRAKNQDQAPFGMPAFSDIPRLRIFWTWFDFYGASLACKYLLSSKKP